MALVNKYRPKSWNDVIGQPAVISILQRQVATRKWKNAYLFCGEYGCGKTTVARIFANDINDGQGSPIEIDGASNNGVDSIRALIADAQQTSLECNFKVYIIDECHMITQQGWNAALKLIEEPPSNSIFIFCTTNPEKLPDTILSRLQRFDFHKVKNNIIADKLEFILNEEYNIPYDRDALDLIASKSHGHVRDAIQFLEKCIDIGHKIDIECVTKTLGVISSVDIMNLINYLYNKNLEKFIKCLQVIENSNIDALKFYDDLLSLSIDCSIYNKLNDIDYTNIPKSLEATLAFPENFIKMLNLRLIKYRQFIDKTNVFIFLKYIALEVCV